MSDCLLELTFKSIDSFLLHLKCSVTSDGSELRIDYARLKNTLSIPPEAKSFNYVISG